MKFPFTSSLAGRVEEMKADFESALPFRHLRINNLMDESFLEKVKEGLAHESYTRRSMDLYDFYQTDDLKNIQESSICTLREALYGPEFRQFIHSVTSIQVNDTIDMSGLVFQEGDYLLCHDDEVDSRRIAFILYMVPPDWEETDGGTLDLFDTEQGHPRNIVKSLVPMWNSLAFFEVTPESFHQVSEVLTSEKLRVSISGWFHGSPLKREIPSVSILSPLPLPFSSNAGNSLTKTWVDPMYLDEKIQKQMKAQFQKNKSLELSAFLNEVPFDAFGDEIEALSSDFWKLEGPPSVRLFNRTLYDTECLKMLCSETFRSLIENVTGYQLQLMSSELRCFDHGHYTLRHDNDAQSKILIDVILCCVAQDWNEADGGSINYLNDEEHLLEVDPENNALSIVLREPGVSQIVKLVKHTAPESRLDVCLTFETR